MKNSQTGRSMVEMLGVLAVIGILSAGALAGYSKAMFQHRLNIQTEQINTVVAAIVRNFEALPTSGAVQWGKLLIRMGEIPKEMYTSDNTNTIKDALNINYTIYHHDTGYTAMVGEIYDNESSVLACRNVLKSLIPGSPEIGYVSILRNYSDKSTSYSTYWWGDKRCDGHYHCLKDMTISDISTACNVCQDTEKCRLFIFF